MNCPAGSITIFALRGAPGTRNPNKMHARVSHEQEIRAAATRLRQPPHRLERSTAEVILRDTTQNV